MKKKDLMLLVADRLGALYAFPESAAALTTEERMEAMERRMRQLEERLDRTALENSSLQKQQAATASTPAVPESFIKLMAGYEQTYFRGGKAGPGATVRNRDTEKVFFTRLQFAF
jgi:hypothetical protein